MSEKKQPKASMAGNIEDSGSASRNRTGSWRTFRPVVTDKCVGCRICEFYCPENCIKVQGEPGKGKARVNYDYCKGCLICMEVCPSKAIEKEREKE